MVRNISFKEGVWRWYRQNKSDIHYKLFMFSAVVAAALLYGFIFKTGIFDG